MATNPSKQKFRTSSLEVGHLLESPPETLIHQSHSQDLKFDVSSFYSLSGSPIACYNTEKQWIFEFPGISETLRFSRDDASISTGLPVKQETGDWKPRFNGYVYGIFGVVESFSGTKIILITKCSSIGVLLHDEVFEIDEVQILPVNNAENPSLNLEGAPLGSVVSFSTSNMAENVTITLPQKMPSSSNQTSSTRSATTRVESKVEQEILNLFNQTGGFYFSRQSSIFSRLRFNTYASSVPSTPTTTTTAPPTTKQEPSSLHGSSNNSNVSTQAHAGGRFFWNYFASQILINGDFSRFVTPVLMGYLEITDVLLQGLEATMAIISRRSRYRGGTRYNQRGIDGDAEVANYVETEQFVVFRGQATSYCILRGSIPLFWSQTPDPLNYRPEPVLTKSASENMPVFGKHMRHLDQTYGPVHIVNLVSGKGREWIVGKAFEDAAMVYKGSELRYSFFDFHERCKGLRFDRISILIDEAKKTFDTQTFTWINTVNQANELVLSQNGVFRVNCMDCLDRTNVVQTFLAREVLLKQFSSLGLMSHASQLDESVEDAFRTMWANNGDMISRQYSGTDAMKRDFTRTGKRNMFGMINDGRNSVIRFYKNNFVDGFKQDAYDLLLGQKTPSMLLARYEDASKNNEGGQKWDQIDELIQYFEDVLVPSEEVFFGGWPVVRIHSASHVEVVLLVSSAAFYLVDYDHTQQEIETHVRIPLSQISVLETGRIESHGSSKNKLLAIISPSGRRSLSCLRLFLKKGAAPLIGEKTRSHEDLATPSPLPSPPRSPSTSSSTLNKLTGGKIAAFIKNRKSSADNVLHSATPSLSDVSESSPWITLRSINEQPDVSAIIAHQMVLAFQKARTKSSHFDIRERQVLSKIETDDPLDKSVTDDIALMM